MLNNTPDDDNEIIRHSDPDTVQATTDKPSLWLSIVNSGPDGDEIDINQVQEERLERHMR